VRCDIYICGVRRLKVKHYAMKALLGSITSIFNIFDMIESL
jgi:hypothetical protein